MTIWTPSLRPTLHDWRASKLYIYIIFIYLFHKWLFGTTIFFEKLMILYLFSSNNKQKHFFFPHKKAHYFFFVGMDPGWPRLRGQSEQAAHTSTHHGGWMDGWMIHGHETVSYWVPVSLTNHGWLISCFFWLSTY